MTWKSQKQIEAELREEVAVLNKIKKLIKQRQQQATYNSNGIVWTMPNQSISISVSELNKIIHNE